jgi:hypothetical protein
MFQVGNLVGHRPMDDEPDSLCPHMTALEVAKLYGMDKPAFIAYGPITAISSDCMVTIRVEGGGGPIPKRSSYTFPVERAEPLSS